MAYYTLFPDGAESYNAVCFDLPKQASQDVETEVVIKGISSKTEHFSLGCKVGTLNHCIYH